MSGMLTCILSDFIIKLPPLLKCFTFSHESRLEKIKVFAYAKTKAQISCAVTALLISYMDSTILLLPKSEILAIFCSCTGRFVSDLVRNPEDRFSRVMPQYDMFFLPCTSTSVLNILNVSPTFIALLCL